VWHDPRAVSPMRTLSVVVVLPLIGPAPKAGRSRIKRDGVKGVVLAPDGSPLTPGAVTLMTSAINRRTVAIANPRARAVNCQVGTSVDDAMPSRR